MSAVDFETLSYLESAADPTSSVFQKMLEDLFDVAEARTFVSGDDEPHAKPWVRKFPFCGSAVENKRMAEMYPEYTIGDRSTFTQGVSSLMAVFDRITSMFLNWRTISAGRVLVVSSYAQELCDMFSASDPLVDHIDFTVSDDIGTQLSKSQYAVVAVDHTTLTMSLNRLLIQCAKHNVSMVEGLFYFNPALDQGWSGIYGEDRILVDHTLDGVNVGPADDPTRILYYPRTVYRQFVDPSVWFGEAKQFFYEIKSHGILSTYQASFVGDMPIEHQTFRVPVCSSSDMVLVTIDRRLANGLFSAIGTYPGVMDGAVTDGLTTQGAVTTSYMSDSVEFDSIASSRDFGIEVRKKLLDDAILYLVGKQKGTDLISEAIKYIAAHNYTDLFEGTRVVSAPALPYTSALCVAVVCAVQAYVLRYGLTNESIRAIVFSRDQARVMAKTGLTGFFSRLGYMLKRYSSKYMIDVPSDLVQVMRARLAATDLIPGVFYDVYRDRTYTIGASWFESGVRSFFHKDISSLPPDDPIAAFMGGNVDASAASYLLDDDANNALSIRLHEDAPHAFQVVAEPVKKLQDVYDTTFPGNSVADLANTAELRKTRDVSIPTEFTGTVKVGMDPSRPEQLHDAMPLRTAALPVGRSGLLDSVLAFAKRNFSVPDMHNITDVWDFSRRLVDEFIANACVPGAAHICKGYMANPKNINVNAYNDWLMGKDEAYYAALLGDIPDELVVLGLQRYTSILKSRIKPKLSVTAQQQIGQPQVVNHQRKVETGVYSGVFRDLFERFDSLLKDSYFSAGRVSDDQISAWLTKHREKILGSVALEADSSMYDKSQSLLALMIEVCMLERLGASAQVTSDLKKSFVGNVSARNAGISFIIAMQRKSGHVDTMIGNLILNFVSLSKSIGYEKIRAMIAKGDDNIAFLDPLLFTGLDAPVVADKIGRNFNIESKMIMDEVPGFSSGGVVPHGNTLRFFPDPLKLIELLGERVADDGLFDEDRFNSFRDRVRAYNHAGLPELIQAWVRRRYKTQSDIVGAIEALLTIASDFALYKTMR